MKESLISQLAEMTIEERIDLICEVQDTMIDNPDDIKNTDRNNNEIVKQIENNHSTNIKSNL